MGYIVYKQVLGVAEPRVFGCKYTMECQQYNGFVSSAVNDIIIIYIRVGSGRDILYTYISFLIIEFFVFPHSLCEN